MDNRHARRLRMTTPKEIRDAISILDELETKFRCKAFEIVREQVQSELLANGDGIAAIIRKGKSVRGMLLGAIGNAAADHVESGDYHLYRGIINPLGPGNDFVKIFDAVVDESVKLGLIDGEWAETQKAALRDNIRNIG